MDGGGGGIALLFSLTSFKRTINLNVSGSDGGSYSWSGYNAKR